ncbi:MAG: DUF1461 domain-containing protein [Coriobacteriales bacterium]|nr:DUF1461 domain-containing protein [Coriobacteriales bacterium]
MGWYEDSKGRHWSSEGYTVVMPVDNIHAPLGRDAYNPQPESFYEVPQQPEPESESVPILVPEPVEEPEPQPQPQPAPEPQPEPQTPAETQVIATPEPKEKSHGFLAFITTILTMLVILVVAFQLLLTPWPTRQFASWYSQPNVAVGMSKAQVEKVADATRSYVNGNGNAVLPQGLDYRSAYTPSIMSHLDDVAKVIMISRCIGLGLLILLIICMCRYAVVSRRAKGTRQGFKIKRSEARAMKAASLILIILVVGIAAFAYFDFNTFFKVFHSLFFEAGTWTFPSNSLLILALPEKFWIAMGALWAGLTVLFSLILLFVGIGKGHGAKKHLK